MDNGEKSNIMFLRLILRLIIFLAIFHPDFPLFGGACKLREVRFNACTCHRDKRVSKHSEETLDSCSFVSSEHSSSACVEIVLALDTFRGTRGH